MAQRDQGAIMLSVANQDHFATLKHGVSDWNRWRRNNPNTNPDLRGADLREADLIGADLHGCDLREVDLTKANLLDADLSCADLRSALLAEANLNRANCQRALLDHAGAFEATLIDADFRRASLQNVVFGPVEAGSANFTDANLSYVGLRRANLRYAKLRKANLLSASLEGADLSDADLGQANLSSASLERAVLVNTSMHGTILSGTRVFGASVWNVDTESAVQENLVVTPEDQPKVTVDNLEVAQFIYLVLNNKKLRNVIETVTSKMILILGRFSPDRKGILDILRLELRNLGYVPVIFDFGPPATRDLTETVSTLAHLARFVIADITDARSIPQELARIVPNLPSVPVQPILLASAAEYGMFETFKRYPWVLKLFQYHDQSDLVEQLRQQVIEPAEALVRRGLSLGISS